MPIEKKDDHINIKVPDEMRRIVDGIAARHGMCRSEWIRRVVEEAIAKERDIYKHLSSVFGDDEP